MTVSPFWVGNGVKRTAHFFTWWTGYAEKDLPFPDDSGLSSWTWIILLSWKYHSLFQRAPRWGAFKRALPWMPYLLECSSTPGFFLLRFNFCSPGLIATLIYVPIPKLRHLPCPCLSAIFYLFSFPTPLFKDYKSFEIDKKIPRIVEHNPVYQLPRMNKCFFFQLLCVLFLTAPAIFALHRGL